MGHNINGTSMPFNEITQNQSKKLSKWTLYKQSPEMIDRDTRLMDAAAWASS